MHAGRAILKPLWFKVITSNVNNHCPTVWSSTSTVRSLLEDQIVLRKSRTGIAFERPSTESVEERLYESHLKNKFKHVNTSQKKTKKKSFQTLDQQSSIDQSINHIRSESTLVLNDDQDFGSLATSQIGSTSGRKTILDAEQLPNDADNLEVMITSSDKRPRKFYFHSMQEAVYTQKHAGVRRAFELYAQMKQERKSIDRKMYSMLIKACSLVGHVDKAIELVDECKKYNVRLNGPMISSMFTCFGRAENRLESISKALQFKDDLELDGYFLNAKNYLVMIKTFGQLGDMDTAFRLFEQMQDKQFSITTETFNMLLMGCQVQSDTGMLMALKLIRQMKQANIGANVHTFVALLKVTRDCGLGSKQALMHFLQTSQQNVAQEEWNGKHRSDSTSIDTGNEIKTIGGEEDHRNLIDKKIRVVADQPNGPTSSLLPMELIDLDFETFNRREGRLQLLGGMSNVISMMKQQQVKPNIRLMTNFVHLLPNTHESAVQLLHTITQELKLKPDAALFNALIKQSNSRHDFASSRELLRLMSTHGVQADLITYGVMAIACQEPQYAHQLLKDMTKSGYKANVIIYGQLVKNACQKQDLQHVEWLLNRMSYEKIRPDETVVEQLLILKHRLSTQDHANKHRIDRNYLQFNRFLERWLMRAPLDVSSDFLQQFQVDEPKRNLPLHEFQVMMTKLIEKKNEKINRPVCEESEL